MFAGDQAQGEVSRNEVGISWITEATQSLKWIPRVGYIVEKWGYHGAGHMDAIDLGPWIPYGFANLRGY